MSKVFDKLTKTLIYCGLDKNDFNKIRDSVAKENRKTAFVWSITSAVYWAYCLTMSFFNADYKLCRYVYLVAFVTAAISIILSVFFSKKSRGVVCVIMYALRVSLLFAGIGIAYCQPDTRSVTMFVMTCIVPYTFIDRTVSAILLIAAEIICYTVFCAGVIQPDIYSFGLITLFIFSTLGLVMGHHINKSRYERSMYSLEIEILADEQRKYANHDGLTGLLNRRAYINAVDNIASFGNSELYAVMADLNGLKAANDTYGHDAGDELLTAAGNCFKKAFGTNDEGVSDKAYVYRTGGDEFFVFYKGTKDEITGCLSRFDEIVGGWKGEMVPKMSISWGFAKCENGDIEESFKIADHMMYENKKRYYEQSGVERRKV